VAAVAERRIPWPADPSGAGVTALSHREPDRVPVDLGRPARPSIGRPGVRATQQLSRAQDPPASQQVAEHRPPRPGHAGALDIDTRSVSQGSPDNCRTSSTKTRLLSDEWSVVRSRPGGQLYYDLTKPPFRGDATAADVEKFPWPDPMTPAVAGGWPRRRGACTRRRLRGRPEHAGGSSTRRNFSEDSRTGLPT